MLQDTFPFLSHSDQARETTVINTNILDTNVPHQKKVLSLGSYEITAYSLYNVKHWAKKETNTWILCELVVPCPGLHGTFDDILSMKWVKLIKLLKGDERGVRKVRKQEFVIKMGKI